MKKKITFLILSLFFVIFSFSPSLYEIYQVKDLPPERAFVLEHNFMFDYNFYLSRIREGQEGRFLVVEKYYNQPHQGSLFQIFYLLMGKLGGLGGLEPSAVYHLARLLMGLMLLMVIGYYLGNFFLGWWSVVAYLLIVTAGSWPIPVKVGNFWRFATYMGWWSAVDSLQRITFIPHVLFGQIFILLFIWRFGSVKDKSSYQTGPAARHPHQVLGTYILRACWGFLHGEPIQGEPTAYVTRLVCWGITGFLVGVVFPPTLVIVYTVFVVLSIFEVGILLLDDKSLKSSQIKEWFKEKGLPRFVFVLLSLPSFFYLQLMFKVMPWRALALFDIEHRMPLPYKEYALSLGPILPLGIAGLIVAAGKREKKLFAVISWMVSIGLLFLIFEKIPTQSPLRFTEAAIQIPLGILTAYFFQSLFNLSSKFSLELKIRRFIRVCVVALMFFIISIGLGVMISMVGWLTDQAKAKRQATWLVPIGAQLAYPLKDFMDGIYYLRDNTKKEDVVLAYVTAGNFIPAYAGNFVYLGHANTPKEEEKEKVAASFFSGKMTPEEAKEFLQKERIFYIYFGPQERELGNIRDLTAVYPFISSVYSNNQVVVYRVL